MACVRVYIFSVIIVRTSLLHPTPFAQSNTFYFSRTEPGVGQRNVMAVLVVCFAGAYIHNNINPFLQQPSVNPWPDT